MSNYNNMKDPRTLPDLYEERLSGVKELKMYDFSVNSLGQVIVTHADFIGKNGLIMFYASWCKYSKDPKIRALWSDLAMILGESFPIGAVNCTDYDNHNDQLAKHANVEGYPTIKLIHKDSTMELYEGPRTKSALMNYICERAKQCNFG